MLVVAACQTTLNAWAGIAAIPVRTMAAGTAGLKSLFTGYRILGSQTRGGKNNSNERGGKMHVSLYRIGGGGAQLGTYRD